MTITVNTTQRSVIRLGPDSTVLELIQALTENLGGEWDNATLRPITPTHLMAGPTSGPWSIEVTLRDDLEPARESNWESDDGQHVAVVTSAVAGDPIVRTCSCEFTGTESEIREHLTQIAFGEQGSR